MTLGEQLFNLIHQLNKGEKRSFKLYLDKNKNRNTAFIFDSLNNMKVYDEQILEQSLRAKTGKKNLKFENDKLKKILFNALTDLLHNNNKELSLGDIINKIELGLKYKLVKITKEWIAKGYEYAEQKQDPLIKVLIMQYELNYTWRIINAPIDVRIKLSEMQKKAIETVEEV